METEQEGLRNRRNIQSGAPEGRPQQGPPGYPPSDVQPGYPPPPSYHPGYPPGAPAPPLVSSPSHPGYATGGAWGAGLAQRLPQQHQANWMMAPAEAPPGCPPGLEYLTQIDQLLVNQQVEILEVITGFETQNRYKVCNSLGQQIYFASEKSGVLQRQCCGSGREFTMVITDNAQREVIRLERPFRCTFPFSFLFIPHTIEVQSPPGTVVGYVDQELYFWEPRFVIRNAEGEVVLTMKGPSCYWCTHKCYTSVSFEVLTADGMHNVGRISKQWSGLAKEYFTDADNFGIQFPMDLDVKMKAVMLGACFLIDFMFFEQGAGGSSHNRGSSHH